MANFYDFDTAYNFEALNTELRAAFPSAGIDIGVTTGTGNQFTVNCPDNITFQEVETVVNNHNPNALTPEQTLQNAKASIKALTTKANNHAARIALCFAAVLESEAQGEDANATFTRITDALNDASVSNGYRTAVMTAFTAKTGLSFDFANLGVVVLVTKQSFNAFSAEFFTRWAFVLTL